MSAIEHHHYHYVMSPRRRVSPVLAVSAVIGAAALGQWALWVLLIGGLGVVLYRPVRAAFLAASGGYREFARLRRARRNQVQARAEYQHHLVMTNPDDPEGLYGAYPPYTW